MSKGWHTDKLVSKTADARVVFHHGSDVGTSFRLVRRPGVVVTVSAEPGTALVIDHVLTLNPDVEHAHHPGDGGKPSLSIIIDIRKNDVGPDEQCALMVLPCWNRVSVYSDPMRVLSYQHETHFLLRVRTLR